MKLVASLLFVATATRTVAGISHQRFGMGDLSDALGAPVARGGSNEGATEGVADLDEYFEPQVRSECHPHVFHFQTSLLPWCHHLLPFAGHLHIPSGAA